MSAVHLPDSMAAGIRDAARAAGLTEREFLIRAARVLAATYGVDIPDAPPVAVKASGVVAGAARRTGRPKKAAAHAMTFDVPAGTFARVCPACGRGFRTDEPKTRYCSPVCKKRAANARQSQK